MNDEVRMTDVPSDRLTHLCAQMTKVLDEPGNDDVKAIVFLNDTDRGGIQMYGYEDPTDGLVDLFLHMKAIFNAQGKDLQFVGIPESPEGIDDE